jgi:Second Messenger Oligonucleotide or Dinucleotide Synthetase domain
MMTVAQAFDQFSRNLALTETQRDEASRQQKALRDKLHEHLRGIDRDILSGSYSRNTAIRPLDDIDLFVILSKDIHRDVYPSGFAQSPQACLSKVQSALARAYPGNGTPKLQRRSVNVEFSGTGIGYDVVPAFEVGGGAYMIPDVDRASWIRTNPEAHKAALVEANRRAGDKLNPLIKMAKLWKRRQRERASDFPLGSFHLEVMAYKAFSTPPPSYSVGLRTLFERLAAEVQNTCRDPADVGPNIDHGMTQQKRDTVSSALRKAAAQAEQALAYEGQGRVEQAHGLWRDLLGPEYPARG